VNQGAGRPAPGICPALEVVGRAEDLKLIREVITAETRRAHDARLTLAQP
jgi:hypothetical protein